MTHTPHELAEEFPSKAERIHLLKISDPHFRRLFDQYHVANRVIHLSETMAAPIEYFVETILRKERIALKDEIAAMLA